MVDIKPLDDDSLNELSNSLPSLIKRVEQDVFKLSLSEPLMEKNPERELDSAETSKIGFVIYKITAKTRLSFVFQSLRVRSLDSGSRRSPEKELGFAGVGGVRKQKELLRELVLHPLNTQLHNKGQSVQLAIFQRCLSSVWNCH